MLETYRECLRDVLDLPGLTELLRKLHARELSVVEVETATASPFASSLLFDYVATYMYEGDTPNAERRAAALALDRDLLRELLGQEELRDLIDPGALEQVEDDLQRLSERTRAESRDALHDVLRRVGDLTTEEAALRVVPGRDVSAGSTQLAGERRAVAIRVGGEQRWIAAEDAGLYRDALGVVPPGGLPEAFLEDVPDALERLVRRYARTHGPFETDALRERYGVDFSPVLDGARARRRPRPRRAAAGRDAARVVRPRGAAAAAPRLAGRAAQGDRAGRPAGARALPARAGRASTAIRRRAPGRPRCARRWSRCRASRCRSTCGSATCCRAASAPTRRRGWTSCARPARSCGSARGRSAATPAGSPCTSARTRGCSGRRRRRRSRRRAARTTRIRERLATGACFFTDLLADIAGVAERGARRTRCGTSCGRAR